MRHLDEGQLHEYLDEENSAQDRARVEGHVHACVECAERLQAARQLRSRTASLLASLEPEQLDAPPWSTLEQRAAKRRAISTDVATSPTDVIASDGSSGTARPAAPTTPTLPPHRVALAGLAWAASLLLAFGLGWFGNSDSLVDSTTASSRAGERAAGTDEARQLGAAGDVRAPQPNDVVFGQSGPEKNTTAEPATVTLLEANPVAENAGRVESSESAPVFERGSVDDPRGNEIDEVGRGGITPATQEGTGAAAAERFADQAQQAPAEAPEPSEEAAAETVAAQLEAATVNRRQASTLRPQAAAADANAKLDGAETDRRPAPSPARAAALPARAEAEADGPEPWSRRDRTADLDAAGEALVAANPRNEPGSDFRGGGPGIRALSTGARGDLEQALGQLVRYRAVAEALSSELNDSAALAAVGSISQMTERDAVDSGDDSTLDEDASVISLERATELLGGPLRRLEQLRLAGIYSGAYGPAEGDPSSDATDGVVQLLYASPAGVGTLLVQRRAPSSTRSAGDDSGTVGDSRDALRRDRNEGSGSENRDDPANAVDATLSADEARRRRALLALRPGSVDNPWTGAPIVTIAWHDGRGYELLLAAPLPLTELVRLALMVR